MAINDFFVWGKGGAKLTPDQIAKQQELAQSLYKQGADFSPAGHWSVALGRGLSGLAGGFLDRSADRAQREGIAGATDAFNNAGIAELLAGGNATVNQPQASSQAATTSSSYQPTGNDVRDGIIATANSLGIDPLDLATAISYETGGTFDPTKSGPTTKWGTHRGLIQFGEPQAKQYGIDWSNPVASQLGEKGAVANYLRDTGVKPGMGLLDVYSAINAGGVGRYNRSDTAAGGAPGTVRDKVEQQMAGHRRKAQALLGDGVQVASADPNFMPQASSEVTMSPVAQALVQPAQAIAAPIQQQAMASPATQPNPVSEALLAQNDMALGGSLAPSQAGQPIRSAPNLQGLIQLANNPFLNDAQRGMVNTALQYQMQQNDPVRALQMQQIQQGLRKGDLEIAAMQNPSKKPIEVGGVLLDPDTYQPIYDSRQKADGGFTLSGGQQRFDANGNLIASVAPKVDPDQYETQRIKMPDGSEVMVERRKGTNEPWQASQIPQGGTTGTGASIRLTEGQSKDTVYSTRAAGALPVIDSLGEYLTNPFERAKEYDPTGLIRGTQSPEYQQAKNAGDEFLQAILRKDTGAAIAKEEMSSYGSVYLPMPGDSKEVLEQKREARSRALNAMQAGMPPEAILAQERALKKTNDQTGKSKPISEMTDAELEAIANGN